MASPCKKDTCQTIWRIGSMKCSDVQMFFDRMVREGETFDNRDVISHMNECDSCSREYAQWRAVTQKLDDAPPLQAPPTLYARVMEEVAISRVRHSFITSLIAQLKSQFVYIPVAVTALLLITLVTMTQLQKQSGYRTSTPVISKGKAPFDSDQENTVMAHFECSYPSAKKITLVGDFNKWDKNRHQLQKNADGTWTIDVRLPKGCYQYLFYVDENNWQTDPRGKKQTPDGFGGYNTVIEL